MALGDGQMRRRLQARVAIAWLIFGLAACEGAVDPPDRTGPLDLVRPWTTASPEDAGIDANALETAAARLDAEPRALSLLVVRSGQLVYERYFHGNHADSLNDVRSITKSVVSTVAGAGVREGWLDVEATLGSILPPDRFDLNPAQQQVRVIDLLTMRGGFEWTEDDYNDWWRADDQLAYLFAHPIVNAPGSVFNYNSPAVHLLGVVLEEASGESLPELADRVLFGPIGVSRVRWEVLRNGQHNGGSGIDLRPRDLARLGQLALQGGATGSVALTDPDWFRRATTPALTLGLTQPGIVTGSYGYLWWTDTGRSSAAFFAWGYGGQYVYVVPDLDLVVVATSNWRGVGADESVLASRMLETITETVLPSVR